MGKSVAQQRRTVAYPSNINHRLLMAEARMSEVSVSSIVDTALRQYYDRMSEEKKRNILEGLR